MLKEEWLTKCCGGDPVSLLRFLDVETYELVGETVMEALLKDGMVRVQDGQSIRQYLTSSNEGEGKFLLLFMLSFVSCSVPGYFSCLTASAKLKDLHTLTNRFYL